MLIICCISISFLNNTKIKVRDFNRGFDSMSSRDTSIVDELILDYLLHNCISALLLEWDVRHAEEVEGGLPRGDVRVLAEADVAQKADRGLLLVNCMIPL